MLDKLKNLLKVPTAQGYTEKLADSLNSSSNQSGSSLFDSGNYVEYKYNQQDYEVEIYLDNTGDFELMKTNPKRYFLNPSAILGMNITESAVDWNTQGSLSFFYLPEGYDGEDDPGKGGQNKDTITQGAKENSKSLMSYQFRGDGFDLLRVMIAPKSRNESNGEVVPSPGVTVNKTNPEWTLSYVFSIYEIEDVSDIPTLQGPVNSYMKCLKLYFHDVRKQILSTTNLEYSTATTSTDPVARTLETGKSLAEVLNKALADPEMGGCEEFKVDENDKDWDLGASKLFYTSPAQSTAFDDVDYLYAHHISTETVGDQLNDLCLFETKRPESYKSIPKLCLIPLSKLFKEAGKEARSPGKLQKEHFVVTGHTSEDTGTLLHRAPIGKDDQIAIDFKSYKYSQIISYSFVDMSPEFNSLQFRTAPVYSVDIGQRVFNIQFVNNEIATAKKTISDTYISELYKKGPAENLFLSTIHKTKKTANVFPKFTLNGEESPEGRILRQKNTFHQLLYSGIFENACVRFKVLGMTLREAGTFIGIDRTEGCKDNDYNNKLYGQWFVVKVEHLFEAGSYMNVIYAVKIHRHTELIEKFEGLLA